MHDLAMRRLAALIIAALLAISGAALAATYFAADERAATNTGNFSNEIGKVLTGTGDDT